MRVHEQRRRCERYFNRTPEPYRREEGREEDGTLLGSMTGEKAINKEWVVVVEGAARARLAKPRRLLHAALLQCAMIAARLAA